MIAWHVWWKPSWQSTSYAQFKEPDITYTKQSGEKILFRLSRVSFSWMSSGLLDNKLLTYWESLYAAFKLVLYAEKWHVWHVTSAVLDIWSVRFIWLKFTVYHRMGFHEFVHVLYVLYIWFLYRKVRYALQDSLVLLITVILGFSYQGIKPSS